MWTQEKTLRLIELWQKTPVLWDSKLKDYRNRDSKRVALEEIASEFHLTALDIEKKLTGLKNQFRREHNKMKTNTSASAYAVEWFGYRPLMFLLESFNPRESTWVDLSNGIKEFPELDNKSSTELCIETDIFLPSESLMGMKEEKEDPPSVEDHHTEEEPSESVSIIYQPAAGSSTPSLSPPQKRRKNHHNFLQLDRAKHLHETSDHDHQNPPQIQIKPFPFSGNALSPETILKTYTNPDSLQINNSDVYSSKHMNDDKKTIHHPHSSIPIYPTSSTASSSNTHRDEFAVYGDYVANCLRKYRDHHSVLVAQNKINNILFDGAIGRFSYFSINSEREQNENSLQVILNHPSSNNLSNSRLATARLSECSSTKRD